jgi:hypothetical protein
LQITPITQTNMLVNRSPVALIDLSVQPPDGQAYQVRVRRVVSMFQIVQFSAWRNRSNDDRSE